MNGVGSTGGLGWHLRALRYRRSLWAGYLTYTAQFLEDWSSQALQPAGVDQLVVVGASAGWSLPPQWLRGFSAIMLIDPDPLAPWLFKRNHPLQSRQTRQWLRQTFESVLPECLAARPQAAVLFNNLLGQLRLVSPDLDATERQLAQIRASLMGRHWASFHDRLSGDWAQAQRSTPVLRASGPIDNAALTKSFAKGGEWLDHLTSQVLPTNAPRIIYPWRITPDRLHVVEAGWVAPNQTLASGPLEPDQA